MRNCCNRPLVGLLGLVSLIAFSSKAGANPPVLSYLFPAGGQKGQELEVRLGGMFLHETCGVKISGPGLQFLSLPKRLPFRWFEGPVLLLQESQQAEDYPKDLAFRLRIEPNAQAGNRLVRVTTSEGVHGNCWFELGHLPEIMEQEFEDIEKPFQVKLPLTINGRIYPRGDFDDWSTDLEKGEIVRAAVSSEKLGLPLDARLEVRGGDSMQILQENDDFNGADPMLVFQAPNKGKYFFRVVDAQGRGSPAHVYRLTLEKTTDLGKGKPVTSENKEPPKEASLTFSLSSLTVTKGKGQASLQLKVARPTGFDSPLRLEWEPLPTGLEVTPAKPVLAKGATQLELKLKAGPDAKIESFSWKVRAVAEKDGKVIAGALAQEEGNFPVDYILVQVALACPFKIVGGYDMKWAPRGGPLTRKYKIERGGYTGPVEVELADKQMRHLQGVRGGKIVVPGGQDEFEYSVQLAPWMEIGRTSRSCVVGSALVDDGGAKHRVSFSSVESNEQLVAVVEAGKCDLKPITSMVGFSPGDKLEIPVQVHRAQGYSGPIRLTPVLPPWLNGWSSKSVELSAQESFGKIILQTSAGAEEPFYLKINAVLITQNGNHEAQGRVEIIPRKGSR